MEAPDKPVEPTATKDLRSAIKETKDFFMSKPGMVVLAGLIVACPPLGLGIVKLLKEENEHDPEHRTDLD